MRRSGVRKMLFAMVTGGLLAAAGLAQAGPPPGPQTRGDAADRPDPARFRAEMEARRAEREAKHEADLVLLLDLKASQRALLHSFLAAERPPMMRRDGPPPGDKADAPSFGDRLTDMQAHLDARTREAQGRLGAARAFYASLDVGQRAKFEAVQRLDGHIGGRRRC